MIVLGLDISSTTIGYAVLRDGKIHDYGHGQLSGTIAARCETAAFLAGTLLDGHQPALVVIESPVARFAKAVIPQARVSGAVLAVLGQRNALWEEVAPSVAKKVLAGCGDANKIQMLDAAAQRAGIGEDVRCYTHKGKRQAYRGDEVLMTEDEADAIGVAFAGAALRVVVKGDVARVAAEYLNE